jgi:hypothetical protein
VWHLESRSRHFVYSNTICAAATRHFFPLILLAPREGRESCTMEKCLARLFLLAKCGASGPFLPGRSFRPFLPFWNAILACRDLCVLKIRCAVGRRIPRRGCLDARCQARHGMTSVGVCVCVCTSTNEGTNLAYEMTEVDACKLLPWQLSN